MGQVFQGSARTRAAVRWAIQNSQESLNKLAGHHGIRRLPEVWKARNRRITRCGKREVAPLLRNLIAAVLSHLYTLLADNGLPLTHTVSKTDTLSCASLSGCAASMASNTV